MHVEVKEGGREDRALWDSVGEIACFGLIVLERDVCLAASQVVGKPSFGVVGHSRLMNFVDKAASGYCVECFANVYCGEKSALWFGLIDSVCDLLCQVG